MFLVLLGVLSWFVAFFSLAAGAASGNVVREVFAAVSFLIGVLAITGSAICSKIDSARDEATSERGQMNDELKAMRAAFERLSPVAVAEPDEEVERESNAG